MSRLCSQCGNNGHNSRTCSEAAAGGAGESNGIMLFGVRLTEGSFRKSASMNNLAQYEQPLDSNTDLVAAGYASDDVVHASARNRERKRGVPWTEEEHKLFLLGLQKVGKGDWRGISRNFVKTRTPTQVASHAQKYFLRRNNHGRRRRRSSLFDMTTDTSMGSTMEEDLFQQEIASLPPPQPLLNINQGFPVSTFSVILPVTGDDFGANLSRGHNKEDRSSLNLIRPIPVHPVPPSSKMADLNLNHRPPPPPSDQNSPPARHSSGFQGMSGGFNGSSGDSIITVA